VQQQLDNLEVEKKDDETLRDIQKILYQTEVSLFVSSVFLALFGYCRLFSFAYLLLLCVHDCLLPFLLLVCVIVDYLPCVYFSDDHILLLSSRPSLLLSAIMCAT
jgi:hypothetical protein